MRLGGTPFGWLVRSILFGLMVGMKVEAARPTAPEAAYAAQVEAGLAVRLAGIPRGGCLEGAQAALRTWTEAGYTGRILIVPPTRYQAGHAMAWLDGPPGWGDGGWCIDPRGPDLARLEWCRSPAVAVLRWRRRPK